MKKDADYTFGDPLQLTSDFYGSGSQVKNLPDNEKLAQFLGLPMSNADNIPTGKDAKTYDRCNLCIYENKKI